MKVPSILGAWLGRLGALAIGIGVALVLNASGCCTPDEVMSPRALPRGEFTANLDGSRTHDYPIADALIRVGEPDEVVEVEYTSSVTGERYRLRFEVVESFQARVYE